MRGVWVFKNLQLRVLTHSRKLFYSNSVILTSSTLICLFNWVDFILFLECYPFRILFLVDGVAGRKCGYKVTSARRVHTLIKVAQQLWITSHTHTHIFFRILWHLGVITNSSAFTLELLELDYILKYILLSLSLLRSWWYILHNPKIPIKVSDICKYTMCHSHASLIHWLWQQGVYPFSDGDRSSCKVEKLTQGHVALVNGGSTYHVVWL